MVGSPSVSSEVQVVVLDIQLLLSLVSYSDLTEDQYRTNIQIPT